MYTINEEKAAYARSLWSFSDYKDGTYTSEYGQKVAECQKLAEWAKSKTKESKHDYIDYLVDKYARKLAEYYNRDIDIQMMCPSVMICGPAKFPTRKKERQLSAQRRNYEFYNSVERIKNRIKSIGNGAIAINCADPAALDDLQDKIDKLKRLQEDMKEINAYYRKNKTLEDCPLLTDEQIAKRTENMKRWGSHQPYPSYLLQNNNAEIHRLQDRLESIQRIKDEGTNEQEYSWGSVVYDTEIMRIKFIFDGKPDEETRNILKGESFKWSPKNSAWQRVLTDNGKRAAERAIKQLEELNI